MSPLILSLDTTHEFGSLALTAGPETVADVLMHSSEGFGHILYEHLARLLDRRITEVTCFAAASGPGSFTGVRVGLACVKGLAEATGKPAVAVSNLKALAFFGSAPLRATVLDARRGEVYGAVYDSKGGPVLAETVMPFVAWLETVPDGEIEFISPDLETYRTVLAGSRFARAKTLTAPRALAAAVGKIAHREIQSGLVYDPAAIDANYVRRADAELFWNWKEEPVT